MLVIIMATLLAAIAYLVYISGKEAIAADEVASYEELLMVHVDNEVLSGIRKGSLMVPLIKIAKYFHIPVKRKEAKCAIKEMLEKLRKLFTALFATQLSKAVEFASEENSDKHIYLVNVETVCILC